jgi:hypothetical protein
MVRLEEVFKISGIPTYTFVRPLEYSALAVALRTHGAARTPPARIREYEVFSIAQHRWASAPSLLATTEAWKAAMIGKGWA